MARNANGAATRLSTYRPVLDRLIFGFAILGILTSVHLHIQQSRGFDRGCLGFSAPEQVEATFDCNVVTQSEASTLLGVSNSVWGLLFYLAIAGLTAAAAFNWGGRRARFKSIRTLLVVAGFLYTLYLVYYQFFGIGELCALCLTSAGITTILAVFHAVDFSTSSDSSTSRSSAMSTRPAREGVFMGALAGLVAVLIIADFAYFNNLESPQAFAAESDPTTQIIAERTGSAADADLPGECRYDTAREPVADYQSLVNFFDASRGNPDAPVTVIEYFDPNCPHCRTMQPVMDAVMETHGDQAYFVFKPFVLWQHSLAQSEALYAAAQEGKFFEMLDHQYAMQQPQTGLSEEQLRSIAEEIGMNPDLLIQRIERGLYRSTLMQERQKGIDAGVQSTPTVLINGRFVESNSRTVECLRSMIEEAAET